MEAQTASQLQMPLEPYRPGPEARVGRRGQRERWCPPPPQPTSPRQCPSASSLHMSLQPSRQMVNPVRAFEQKNSHLHLPSV